RFDADASPGHVEHAGIASEILAYKSPDDPEGVAQRARREHTQVEHSIILDDARAEREQLPEDRSEIGDHDGGRSTLLDLPVDCRSHRERVEVERGAG